MRRKEKTHFVRFGLILISLMVIGTGWVPLIIEDEMFYSNWWGGLVFAPITMFIGISLLYLVLFKYEKINKMK